MIKRPISERKKLTNETLGKAYYDLGKLSFAGLSVGSIVQVSSGTSVKSIVAVVVLGILMTSAFFIAGHLTLRQAR